jgi:hypothetical protein
VVRFPRVCRGRSAWHARREASRTWETPSAPGGQGKGMRLLRHRRGNPAKEPDRDRSPAHRGSHPDREGREAGSCWGVRPTHSTASTGEPCTSGRGRQSYAACKGNFNRTRRAGS